VDLTPLRIVVAFPLPFYTPLWVAARRGLFAAEAIDARIIAPPPGQTIRFLESGQADVALSGVMRTFILADRGQRPPVAIAEVNSRDGFLLLAREPTPGFRWTDLEGRRVALFGEAPTPWMCLQDVLRRHGADPARLTLLRDLPAPEAIRVFLEGGADYLETAQPMAEELLAGGRAHLAAAMAEPVGHVPYSSLAVTPEFRERHPDVCAGAVRALARALDWIARTPPAAVAECVGSDFPAIAPALLRRVVERYHAAGTWAAGPRQAREPFERFGRILQAGGLIGTVARYEDLVDDRFAAAAVGRGGAS
jgi:NitT/TauT family transport system substrate-binding protein